MSPTSLALLIPGGTFHFWALPPPLSLQRVEPEPLLAQILPKGSEWLSLIFFLEVTYFNHLNIILSFVIRNNIQQVSVYILVIYIFFSAS